MPSHVTWVPYHSCLPLQGEDGSGGSAAPGPTNFANLRQLAGMPGAGQQQQRKRAGSNLVSRLKAPAHRAGKEPVGSQPADADASAAAAVAAVLATSGRRATAR